MAAWRNDEEDAAIVRLEKREADYHYRLEASLPDRGCTTLEPTPLALIILDCYIINSKYIGDGTPDWYETDRDRRSIYRKERSKRPHQSKRPGALKIAKTR